MTKTERVLAGIQHSFLGQLIGKSNHMVIAVLQLFHVFGILLLLTSLILISLRLLGLAMTDQSLPSVAREPGRLMSAGISVTITSGVLIFVSGPAHYYYNKAFDLKMLLLLCALTLHLLVFRRLERCQTVRPLVARLVVGFSLFFWFGVGIAGRAIGFV